MDKSCTFGDLAKINNRIAVDTYQRAISFAYMSKDWATLIRLIDGYREIYTTNN